MLYILNSQLFCNASCYFGLYAYLEYPLYYISEWGVLVLAGSVLVIKQKSKSRLPSPSGSLTELDGDSTKHSES